jgi:aryl-alcohol dehydrogenase-like predicted oxidoreductase
VPGATYVTLGRSGLRVSPMCLGAMTFGQEWGWGADPDTSRRIMDAYIDRGGNFIDTANIYTRGHSERIIGDHIGRFAARRDRLVIATKFMGAMHAGDPNSGGGHRKAILAACDESLRRLQTTYIDLYWMHFWDSLTPIDETLRALDDLVSAGKVRYIGFSDTPAWTCAEAQTIARFRGCAPVIGLQIEYSLLERTVEHELIPMARHMGMGRSSQSGGGSTSARTRSSTCCGGSPARSAPAWRRRRWRGCSVARESPASSSGRARSNSSRTTSARRTWRSTRGTWRRSMT